MFTRNYTHRVTGQTVQVNVSDEDIYKLCDHVDRLLFAHHEHRELPPGWIPETIQGFPVDQNLCFVPLQSAIESLEAMGWRNLTRGVPIHSLLHDLGYVLMQVRDSFGVEEEVILW